MKGLLLSSFYASKKSLITYTIIAILAAIYFAFINPIMVCFLPMIFLLSPVTDNIKREKDSRWMYFVATLPTGRSTYIKSYFAFYGVLILIGLFIGVVANLLINKDFGLTLIAILVGIGGAGTYAMMFPLTFKFGPENSNVIMITTSVIVIGLFFLVFFGFIMANIASEESFKELANVANNYIVTGIYALVGVSFFVFSYISSLKIFDKQEL